MNRSASEAANPGDAAVFADARRALDYCPTIPETIRVHVGNDVVVLTGSVRQPSQRAEAERVVRPVIGDRRLLNNIIVMADKDFERLDDRH